MLNYNATIRLNSLTKELRLEKIRTYYINIAILFFNLCLILLCCNIFFFLYGQTQPEAFAYPTPIPAGQRPLYVNETAWGNNYTFDMLERIYAGRSPEDALWIAIETSVLHLTCDTYSPHREQTFDGTFINVDSQGFRWLDNGIEPLWPPPNEDYVVFVFGGSTTFGYGESDNLTIPAYLEYYLRQQYNTTRIHVYNFGRGGFTSTEERELFTGLTEDGFRPDLALFIDGLNEFRLWNGQPYERQSCIDRLTLAERIDNTLTCDANEWCLPIQHWLADQFDTDTYTAPVDVRDSEPAVDPPNDDRPTNEAVLMRWYRNKAEIEAQAQKWGIETLFIMQPIPVYAYNMEQHLFFKTPESAGKWARGHWGYALWEEDYQTGNWTTNVLNLARLGEDNEGLLYLDKVHYTYWFMDEIALAITEDLVKRDFIHLEGAE